MRLIDIEELLLLLDKNINYDFLIRILDSNKIKYNHYYIPLCRNWNYTIKTLEEGQFSENSIVLYSASNDMIGNYSHNGLSIVAYLIIDCEDLWNFSNICNRMINLRIFI